MVRLLSGIGQAAVPSAQSSIFAANASAGKTAIANVEFEGLCQEISGLRVLLVFQLDADSGIHLSHSRWLPGLYGSVALTFLFVFRSAPTCNRSRSL